MVNNTTTKHLEDKTMGNLYTEKEIRKILNSPMGEAETVDEFISNLTPIQLPTDEEIDKYINSFPYTKHLDDGQYNDGVIVGAELGIEWMRDKIKGGNNE